MQRHVFHEHEAGEQAARAGADDAGEIEQRKLAAGVFAGRYGRMAEQRECDAEQRARCDDEHEAVFPMTHRSSDGRERRHHENQRARHQHPARES
jgi:hypothetical protein